MLASFVCRPRLRTWAAAVFVSFAALSIVPSSEAQPKTGKKQKNPDEERAFMLYEQGRQAYREGRYDEAITLLNESYRLKPEPVLMFNIAKAYESRGRLKEAIQAYEDFLKTAKEVPDRATIESKVVNLKAALQKEEDDARAKAKAEAAAKTPVNKPDVAPSLPLARDEEASANPVPWIIAGVGGAGLIAGGVLGGLALSKNGSVETATSQQEAQAARSSAEGMALGSNIAFGVGGAVLLGGAIWGIVDLTSSGERPNETTVQATAGLGSIQLQVTF
jgi:tetratricopeptide (TPR) repeat protein